MTTLRYKIGQERKVLCETHNLDDSIFKSQYERALEVTEGYLQDKDSDSLKILAFTGERGEGKTSCMESVTQILTGISEPKSEFKKFAERVCHDFNTSSLGKARFITLNAIDPSFFDEEHNVLEIVVGWMFRMAMSSKSSASHCQYERNELMAEFSKVKNCLCMIHDKNSNVIDYSRELDVLANSVALKTHMASLVKSFLKYMGGDILLIPIDDIDLNMRHAYMMCEQIRKYLAIPACLVFVAVKVEQLQEAVSMNYLRQAELGKVFAGQSPKENHTDSNIEQDINGMAKKYIDKLLPLVSRIEMPKVYDFCDVYFEILGKDDKPEVKSYDSLRLAVPELIFSHTRFLFYNPVGGNSPIIPNNLRELLNLIGMLETMELIQDSKDSHKKGILERNKRLFKHYFFRVWMNRFEGYLYERLESLVNTDFGTSFNKEMVELLKDHFKTSLGKDYDESQEDEPYDESALEDQQSNRQSNKPSEKSTETLSAVTLTINSITDDKNFAYNITVGDVFYLFSLLERETLNDVDSSLIFFLKSLYSIKLYEAYDRVTEIGGQVYPDTKESEQGISVINRRYERTNALQHLVGGSYFTFCPGDLITISEKNAIDLRIIKGKPLNDLLGEIRTELPEISNLETTDERRVKFTQKLNIAEYFILSIRCSVKQKTFAKAGTTKVVQAIARTRANVVPFQCSKYFKETGYYVFDVLAPFANIINPEFTYNRFPYIDDTLYKDILGFEGSILNSMIKECDNRTHIVYEGDTERQSIHRLLSDAVIRNAVVLSALKERLVVDKLQSQDKGGIYYLPTFYKSICKSVMDLYLINQNDSGEDQNRRYKISFSFIKPLQTLVESLLLENGDEDSLTLFKTLLSLENKTAKKLTKDFILSEFGSCRTSKSLRTRLRKADAFSSLSSITMKLLIPDKQGDFTPEEREKLASNIYDITRSLPTPLKDEDIALRLRNNGPERRVGNMPPEIHENREQQIVEAHVEHGPDVQDERNANPENLQDGDEN